MIINDETIQNMRASLESRGYEVVNIIADDKHVLAEVKTRFGQTIKMKLPISMFDKMKGES